MPERTYKIGEVGKLLQVPSFTLRFWETEFSQLHPKRTDKGQRLYSEADVDLLRRIRSLLYDRGLTIEGARKTLQGRAEPGFEDEPEEPGEAAERPLPSLPATGESGAASQKVIRRTLEELRSIRELLRSPGSAS